MHARTYSQKGFTLPEVLLIVGLLTFLIGLSALAGSDSYQRALAASDIERVAGALRHARSLAQANACQTSDCSESLPIGVRITSEELRLFSGTAFNESSVFEKIPLSSAFSIEAADIIFFHRSGYPFEKKTVRMTDAYGRDRLITVNEASTITVEPI